MKVFDRYRLEKEGSVYTLVLYLNKSCTEFSDELRCLNKHQENNLTLTVQDYVRNNFPHLSINKVNVVYGSLVISTLTL
jgi:hypothetical protein